MVQFRVGSVPEHFTLPWHLAQENKLFEAQGVSVQWQDYPGGTGAMMADLRSGELDVAIALTEGVIADIIKEGKNKIVQLFVNSPLSWGIHVSSVSAHRTVADLEGKAFAVSRLGSGSHLMAFVMAKQQGWSTEELTLQVVGGMEGACQALADGHADAFMWEKFMTQPLVDSGEFRRVGVFDTPWPCFVVVASDEMLSSQPEVLRKVLITVQQSAQDFMQHPQAEKLVAKRYNLTEEDARTWFARTSWATDFRIKESMLEQVVTDLVDCQVVSTRVSPKDLCSPLVQLY